jgi:hypothetical protein
MPEPECINPRSAERCHRFLTCNASHCPLSGEGLHLHGESICYYLRVSGKAEAAEKFQGDPIFSESVDKLPGIVAKYSDIGKRVDQCSKTPFAVQNCNPKSKVRKPEVSSVTK